MPGDELRRAEENDRLDWLADGEARTLADLPQPYPILKANMDAWEAYAASPHFTDGDRRQDFDNGWDEARRWAAQHYC